MAMLTNRKCKQAQSPNWKFFFLLSLENVPLPRLIIAGLLLEQTIKYLYPNFKVKMGISLKVKSFFSTFSIRVFFNILCLADEQIIKLYMITFGTICCFTIIIKVIKSWILLQGKWASSETKVSEWELIQVGHIFR